MNIPTDKSTLQKLFHTYPLCDSCFGRLYRSFFRGITNQEQGTQLRGFIGEHASVPAQRCWICEGLLDEIDHFVDLIKVALNGYEFSSFLVGSRIDIDILKRQQQLADQLGVDEPEPCKMELNRRIGKKLNEVLKVPVDFSQPDIITLIDTSYDVVRLQIKSLFFYGRYRKLKRGVPQTRWPCRICRGKGCQQCGFSGKKYATSVEELIGDPLLTSLQGKNIAFHGSGREDIDALMLGTGRPFVVEIKQPKKRNMEPEFLAQLINQEADQVIEVIDFRVSNKEEAVRLKHADFRKTYRVYIKAAAPIDKAKLKEGAAILRGATVRQQTPIRVAHRRADKIRERTIYRCDIETVTDIYAELVLETEAGTYIKELISGDQGRTEPNVSDLIGIPCTVTELDVLEIKGE